MEEFAEINITPFTDVLLVLLIIFMVLAALIAPAGFERRVSHCCAPQAITRFAHSKLDIAENGKMALDGRPVDTQTIYPALRALHASKRSIALSIAGHRETPYGYVIRAMDAAKMAGITNVSFVSL
jgi:biopolymer transport protein ExbD